MLAIGKMKECSTYSVCNKDIGGKRAVQIKGEDFCFDCFDNKDGTIQPVKNAVKDTNQD